MKKTFSISIILIMILVLQMILPLYTNAVKINNEEEKLIGAGENSINVSLKRDSEDKNKINITATDSAYKITELKYVHKYIKIEEIEYFEADNEDVHTISITPAQKIEQSFEMDGYGSYTVYVKNEKGDRYLSRMTIKDPAEMPDITLTRDSDDMRKLEIQVTSKSNKIVKIKIAKKEKYDDTIDFETQGEELEFEQSNNVNVKYTSSTQNGIYVIYAEDDQGNKSTSQTYLGETKTPIQTKTTLDNKSRKAKIEIEDSLCKIVKVKVAKKSKINNINDFKTEGESIEIVPANSINIEYVAPEDDTYMFYIEDEAGYKKMIQMRITKENSIDISVSQDDNDKKIITIKATDSICNIVKIKVAAGDNIDSDYFKTNGQELQITPGKEVEVKCSVSENCILNIYVEDEDGYKVITTRNIIGIPVDDNKPDDNKPDDSKPDDSKPDDSKPDDNKPDDNKPDDSKPDDSKPDDSKPDDSKPDDSKPDDSKPDDRKPDDSKPDDSKPDDSKPDDSKPDDSKPDDKKQDDNKQKDNKQDDNKKGDNKKGDNKQDDNKQDYNKQNNNNQNNNTQNDNKQQNNNSNNNKQNNANNNSNQKETTTNNQSNVNSNSSNSSTTSQSNLPKTGWNNIMLVITTGIVAICAVVSFIKYKKIK